MTNLYDFTVKAQDSSDVQLSKYQGKILLIVNTATGCGLTHNTKDYKSFTTLTMTKDLKF